MRISATSVNENYAGGQHSTGGASSGKDRSDITTEGPTALPQTTETAHLLLHAMNFPSPSQHPLLTSVQHYKDSYTLQYNPSDILKLIRGYF